MTHPMPPALNPVGRPKGVDLADLPVLTSEQLTAVRLLAADGARVPGIRRALGLSVGQWKRLFDAVTDDGEPSPLHQAMEEGIAEGAATVIAFMRARMADGDVRAAEFLADRVYRISKSDQPEDNTPKVQIILNAPLSLEAYNSLRIEAHP